MKKVIIDLGSAQQSSITQSFTGRGQITMTERFEFQADEMSVSDGYHTFDELYDHRITLFIAFCKLLQRDSENAHNRSEPRETYYRNGNVWRSKKHHDGSSFDGWFIMGIRTDPGSQITYHLPINRWDETDFAYTFEEAPNWDGHTSADVLERIKNLVK